jgi:two-component sensor histidine kinase
VVPEAAGQDFFERLDSVFASGERYVARDLPIRLRRALDAEPQERFLDFIYEPSFDETGQVSGVFVQGYDVTETRLAREAERRHRRHLKLLIDELNHRVKNTLAIVQGIAQQTFRDDAASAPARQAFEGRLVALAATYNVLTNARWEASDLREVISEAVAGHAPVTGRVTLEGPPTPVGPKTAVAIAMAVHELATNATKYGALSTDRGRVSIVWTVESDRRALLVWTETGGPRVDPPSRRGFGTRMIERALASEVGGRASLDFAPSGVVCEIRFGLPAVETPQDAARDEGDAPGDGAVG